VSPAFIVSGPGWKDKLLIITSCVTGNAFVPRQQKKITPNKRDNSFFTSRPLGKYY